MNECIGTLVPEPIDNFSHSKSHHIKSFTVALGRNKGISSFLFFCLSVYISSSFVKNHSCFSFTKTTSGCIKIVFLRSQELAAMSQSPLTYSSLIFICFRTLEGKMSCFLMANKKEHSL